MYRNHVYRVYNLAVVNIPAAPEQELLAITSAFHDLGIWTAKTFDYIEPSVQLAKQFMEQRQFTVEQMQLVTQAIALHHKVRAVTEMSFVENFRRADLYDLSLGLAGGSYNTGFTRKLYKVFPPRGFHGFLVKLFLRQLFITPLNPLPMFK
jgi:hypothetical protein